MKCERLGQPTRLFNHCSFHRLIRIRVKWCRSSGATLASDICRFRPITYPIRSSATPLPRKHCNPIVLNSLYSACSSSGLLLISTPPSADYALSIVYLEVTQYVRVNWTIHVENTFTMCAHLSFSQILKDYQSQPNYHNFAEACVQWTILHCFPATCVGLLMYMFILLKVLISTSVTSVVNVKAISKIACMRDNTSFDQHI